MVQFSCVNKTNAIDHSDEINEVTTLRKYLPTVCNPAPGFYPAPLLSSNIHSIPVTLVLNDQYSFKWKIMKQQQLSLQ